MEKGCDVDGGKLGGMVAAKNNEMRKNINRSANIKYSSLQACLLLKNCDQICFIRCNSSKFLPFTCCV